MHNNVYYDQVNNLLREAASRQDVIEILKYIAYGDVKRSLMRSKSVKMRSNRPNQAGIPYAAKGS